MSELKLPRLLAAAKEFNIGQDTLVDFLAGKGFNRDELKPTAKLSEAMYRALQQEFQSDKAIKTKADQIEIPKAQASVSAGKKKKIIITEEKKEKWQHQHHLHLPLLPRKSLSLLQLQHLPLPRYHLLS